MDETPAKPVAFALRMSRPFRVWAAGAMLAVLVATAASRVMSYVIKLLIDGAIAFGQGRAEVGEIWHWALVFPAVYLGNEVVWRTSGFCGMRWITGAVAEVNRRLFAHLSEHSATYFRDRYAGALVNKIANAASGTEHLISQTARQSAGSRHGLQARGGRQRLPRRSRGVPGDERGLCPVLRDALSGPDHGAAGRTGRAACE